MEHLDIMSYKWRNIPVIRGKHSCGTLIVTSPLPRSGLVAFTAAL